MPTFEPADDTSPTYHAGDVSLDGILYLFTISKKDTLYLVDVNRLSINYLKTLPSIHLDSEVDMSDFAFSPIDNMIYTVDWNENLIKIDQNSGQVTNLGHLDAIPSSGNVTSIFFDKDGNLYAHHSYKADVYKIDISKVKAEYCSNIGTTLHGDGARCANAKISDAKISEIKPKISINNVTKLEGDSGFTDFNFTISLNKPAPKGGLTFDYTTKDGTAGDEDFSDNNDTNNTTVNNSDNNDNSNSSSGGSSWWDIIKDWLNGQSSHHDKKSLTSIEKHNSKKNISFQIGTGTIITDDENISKKLLAEYRFDECILNGTNGVFRIKYNYNYGNDKLGLYTTFSDKSSRSFYKTDIGLKDKAWHYLAVTYENREYKIYLDKQLVVSKKYNKDLISPNNELHIGGKAYVSNMYIDYDLKVYFQPYGFDVNLDVKSKTNSGHNNFLYMSDLSKSNKMAILIDGNITAKEKNGQTTTNFTKDCLAHKVQLSLDYTITTDRGVFHNPNPDTVIIRTTKKTALNPEGTIIKIQKKKEINNSSNKEDYKSEISESNTLDNNLTLKEEDFEKSKKEL